MAKKKVVNEEKLKLTDIVGLAKAGWTPGEVNALLDRMDSLGDLTAPDPKPEGEDDDEEDEDLDIDDSSEDESDEDDIDNDSGESEENTTQKETSNTLNSLEVENKRLKRQLEKLQAKNRSKDVSGAKDEKPIEKSLIDMVQSLFD